MIAKISTIIFGIAFFCAYFLRIEIFSLIAAAAAGVLAIALLAGA